MIVVLMLVAGAALIVAGVAVAAGPAAALITAGVALVAGAYLTNQVLEEGA